MGKFNSFWSHEIDLHVSRILRNSWVANSIRDRRCLQLLLLCIYFYSRVADISRNPNLYFEMAILIGKSRRRVNIIIWETSAWAAAHQTASAELKKHKGSRGGDEPWSGGDPFGLPARIRRHVGRGNRRERGGGGSGGRVSMQCKHR